MSKPKSGERFKNLEHMLGKEKGVTDPAALAASIGRKKLGEKKMEKLSERGKEIKKKK